MEPSGEWDTLLQTVPFAPLASQLHRLAAGRFPTLDELNALLPSQAITVQSGKPIRFVEQGAGRLAFEQQYEPRCYLAGEVQTRQDNWHDFFNALVWLTFPNSKSAINARHYQAMTRDASAVVSHSKRGAVRDTGTLLDESGVIVAYAEDELAGLLRNFRWKELFWERRKRVEDRMGFYLFGHGLYEKALRPYTGMTGQGWLLAVEPDFFSWPLAQQLVHLDRRLAADLGRPDSCQSTRELSPVPLLGVPGWTGESESAAYYDNQAYFRPGRRTG